VFHFLPHISKSHPSMRPFSHTRQLLQSQLLQLTSRMGSLEVGLRTLAQCHSLAISESEDDPEVRRKYRPFLLPADVEANDWISELELETVIHVAEKDLARTQSRLKVLVLYGSLRQRFVLISIHSPPSTPASQPTHPY
jgi:hypothetical protein